jgi:hypothetical protein
MRSLNITRDGVHTADPEENREPSPELVRVAQELKGHEAVAPRVHEVERGPAAVEAVPHLDRNGCSRPSHVTTITGNVTAITGDGKQGWTTVTNMNPVHDIQASGLLQPPVIGRVWRGRTRADHADEYLAYGYEHGVHRIATRPGCLGVQYFRQISGDVAEFTVISYWASVEEMRNMHADQDGDVLRVWPLDRDPEFLLELPERVVLTELHVNDWPIDSRIDGDAASGQ